MTTRIINRGRGTEIEGTRITVYRIMDFVRDNCSMTTIADELDLSEAQVHAALDGSDIQVMLAGNGGFATR